MLWFLTFPCTQSARSALSLDSLELGTPPPLTLFCFGQVFVIWLLKDMLLRENRYIFKVMLLLGFQTHFSKA